eukprot:TRINITY_DN3435_c0_g9_i1.p2 TRINITY_DN3435_c0_g9~~TRINITY_DN3435_c0_g9_i1.p2  ORF type:complete len:373 (+),score=72.07 TRINITY_DN3435_c0_g9_i1:80-1198(+)
MYTAEELAELSSAEYVRHFQIDFYLRDLLGHLAEHRLHTDASGEFRSAPDLAGRYFDSVLRGSHVAGRGYVYASATPTNRRALVTLLRRGLAGVSQPHQTALTVVDFHDLLLPICADFPLQLVVEASTFAEEADGLRQHLLCESTPFASSKTLRREGEDESGLSCHEPLWVFSSLQLCVEFCFVYRELLAELRDVYCVASQKMSRSELWKELRSRLRGEAALGAALPSDRALLRWLRAPPGAPERPTLQEAVTEMAAHFELMLPERPEEDGSWERPVELAEKLNLSLSGASGGATSSLSERPRRSVERRKSFENVHHAVAACCSHLSSCGLGATSAKATAEEAQTVCSFMSVWLARSHDVRGTSGSQAPKET